MSFFATTTVSVLRGTTTDQYGDEKDNDTVSASGVEVSIIEQSRKVFVPAENRLTEVRTIVGRASQDADIQETDRLRDENDTSKIYIVESVAKPQTPFGFQTNAKLDLRRIGDA